VEKKLSETLAALKANYPDAEIQLWAEDEHRIGLHPVNRRIWVPQGEVPLASVNWKYQWLWLIGFVEPKSGQTYWWIVPLLNWQVMEKVLADFAEHFELGPNKRVVLVLDQASFHVSERIQVPEGMHLEFLPPKSPELQPAERLWPLTNEAMANRTFESLDELEEVSAHRCRVLMQRREFIQGLTGYHWWLDATAQL
jgi:transposase